MTAVPAGAPVPATVTAVPVTVAMVVPLAWRIAPLGTGGRGCQPLGGQNQTERKRDKHTKHNPPH